MACKIQRAEPQAVFDRAKNMFSSTVLNGGNVIPESNEWYVVSLHYAMTEEFFSMSERAWNERDPRYACCDNLIEIAARDGVYPYPAQAAQGYIGITGIAGTVIPQQITFQFGNEVYAPAGTVPAQLGDDGTAVIRARAIVPGPDGNLPSTATGTVVGATAGINAAATVYGGRFCGGRVAEECEPFRQRYLNRLAFQTNYGVDKVKQQVLDWPCVTSVCERGAICCSVTPEEYNQGIVCKKPIELYALFDGTFDCGLPPECVTDEITDWLFGSPQGIGLGVAEWGMYGKVYAARAAYINIAVTGLSCNTPSQSAAILERVRDFAQRICPSEALSASDLKMIVAQILGKSDGFEIVMSAVDPTNPDVSINYCGDAVPVCDVKICINNVQLMGATALNAGVCP